MLGDSRTAVDVSAPADPRSASKTLLAHLFPFVSSFYVAQSGIFQAGLPVALAVARRTTPIREDKCRFLLASMR